jgi:hypothetical protein
MNWMLNGRFVTLTETEGPRSICDLGVGPACAFSNGFAQACSARWRTTP